jgi:hypothetical protein
VDEGHPLDKRWLATGRDSTVEPTEPNPPSEKTDMSTSTAPGVTGTLLTPDSPGYHDARRIWNGGICTRLCAPGPDAVP